VARRARKDVALACLLVSVLTGACGSDRNGLDRVPEGRWGGEGIALDVRPTGAAVDLDCAHGEITVPLRLEADGSFRLPGYYVRDVGPATDPEERRPATYFGSSDGRRLTLSFALESGEAAGPFAATLGAPANVQRCR
jgi:hypothetical protein